MKRQHLMLFVFFVVLAGLFILPFYSNTPYAADAEAAHEEALTEVVEEEVPFDIPVEEIQKYLAPMNELELFPCSDCHDEEWEADSTRRDLDEPHDVIPGAFVNHDADNRWCLDCHSANMRDKFRLLNGKLVEYNEYYRVCAQCHRRVYREWKMGVHGKRTGYWNGEKQWMHCAQCHNPHNPPFKPIKPMPMPRKPGSVWSATPLQKSQTGDAH